jgi:hypothetical protein
MPRNIYISLLISLMIVLSSIILAMNEVDAGIFNGIIQFINWPLFIVSFFGDGFLLLDSIGISLWKKLQKR